MKKQLKLTQIHSTHACLPKHKACIAGLGLRHTYDTVEVEDTPAIRGMINKVIYLLKVEEVPSSCV